jgi:pyridoxamine 5'-phosphate oxidase
MRSDYTREALAEADVDADPVVQFRRWFDQATEAGLLEPTAMTLATATPDGRPSARMVLLRGFDDRGFCFYTNYESRKGAELAANPRAALVFWWGELQRQIRIEGRAALERRVAQLATGLPDGQMPLPEFWGGFRLAHEVVEFWQGRPNRLHDRLRYRRVGGTWTIERLAP